MSNPGVSASENSKLKCLSCDAEFSSDAGFKVCPNDQTLLCPVSEDRLVNLVLDSKYEIQQVIGVGGFGRVYKARHLFMDKIVAVKVMTGNFQKDPSLLDRFVREAKITNQLIHSNIVCTLDHGIEPQPYIVMEFVEGETLESKLKKNGPLSFEEFFEVFDQICRAISLAHQSGFLHRDLKPSNIMLDEHTGLAKVLDFGLVKMQGQDLTSTGEIMGSPPYMSPEQCRGSSLDERTDIYAIGCVMYEALTGVKAFEGKTAVDTMYMHFNTTPPSIVSLRKDCPKDLDYVVGRAFSDWKDRYKSVEDLRVDLSKAQSGTLRGRLPRITRPVYQKSVRSFARISTLGNWTIVLIYILVRLILVWR